MLPFGTFWSSWWQWCWWQWCWWQWTMMKFAACSLLRSFFNGNIIRIWSSNLLVVVYSTYYRLFFLCNKTCDSLLHTRSKIHKIQTCNWKNLSPAKHFLHKTILFLKNLFHWWCDTSPNKKGKWKLTFFPYMPFCSSLRKNEIWHKFVVVKIFTL